MALNDSLSTDTLVRKTSPSETWDALRKDDDDACLDTELICGFTSSEFSLVLVLFKSSMSEPFILSTSANQIIIKNYKNTIKLRYLIHVSASTISFKNL